MSTTAKIKIPVLNLHDYMHGDAAQKAAFVKAWGDGLKHLGFVAIENHGMDPAVIKRCYELFAEFFSLPQEVKDQYGKTHGGQRGYTSFGKEHAKDSKVGDLKEFWHTGRPMPADHPYKGRYPENVWPKELAELETNNMAIFNQLEEVAFTLMRALGDYFELEDREYFVKAITGGNTIIRAIHYPPLLPEMDPRAVRAAAHEDINMITILCEATSAGLEILTHDGTWLPIDALKGQLIVDSGDMLSRLTNDVIPATTHRVVNPEGPNERRYSLPFFVHPHSDFNIECLPQCNTADNPAKYPPITAEGFLNQRLKEIGLTK